MSMLEPKHFLMPFLAHALGSLVGAWIATKIAPMSRSIPALVIGLFFLAAGMYMANILPAPRWFEALDLIVAYIPAALIGYTLARSSHRRHTVAGR